MAITIEELVIELRGEIGDLKKSLKEAAEETKEKAGIMSGAFEVFTGTVTAHALLEGIGKLKDLSVELFNHYIVEGVKAAQEYEDAVSGLNQALAASGKYTDTVSRSLETYASEIQKTTKYGDEAVLGAASLIQSLGRLDEDGLKKATTAALDLSQAMHIDLHAAALAVGKAADGNTAALGRYVKGIEDGNTKSETFANALQKLSQKFGGAAEAAGGTFSGALAKLKHAQEDQVKEIGNVIIKNQSLINVIGTLAGSTSDSAEAIKKNRQAYSDLVSKGILYFLDACSVAVSLTETAAVGFLKLYEAAVLVQIGISEATDTITLGMTDAGKRVAAGAEEFEKLEATIKKLEGGNSILGDMQDKIASLKQAAQAGFGQIADSSDLSERAMRNAASATRELTASQLALQEAAQKLVDGSGGEEARLEKEIETLRAAEDQKLAIRGDSDAAIQERIQALADFRNEADAQEVEALITKNAIMRELHSVAYQDEIAANQAAIDKMMFAHQTSSDVDLKLQKKVVDEKKKLSDQEKRDRSEALSFISTLQNSKSKEMAAVGKAAAIASATIATYDAATKAYAALAGIPFVGPALGAAAAAAAIAAGLSNVAQIAGVNIGFQGGVDMVPGMGYGDKIPAILEPRERVVPGRTNKILEEMLLDYRGMKAAGGMFGGSGGSAVIELRMVGDLGQIIEAKLIERTRLSTSLVAA